MSHGKIICDAVVSDNSAYYGDIHVSNIRYEDGSSVAAQQFLGIMFKSPSWTKDPDIYSSLTPYQETSTDVSDEEVGDGTLNVTVKLILTESHTFIPSDTINFGINGDLSGDTDPYTKSFRLYADKLPSGTVEIDCATAPDTVLTGSDQVVNLERGGRPTPLSVRPGKTASYQVLTGNYTVTAEELTNGDETTVAVAQASTSQVTVEEDSSVAIRVTYGAVQKFSSIDLTIGQLSSPIEHEQLHIKVVDHTSGDSLLTGDTFSPNNHTTSLRRLPKSGTADISAEITVNNVRYLATETVELKNNLSPVSFSEDDIETKDVDTSDFVDLPVEIKTDVDKSGATIFVRLVSTSSDWIYTQTFNASTSSTKFAEPVAPGQYTVQTSGFIDNSTAYGVFAPASLKVANDGSATLDLTIKRGAYLKVAGFPDYLSFGGLTDVVDLTGADFIAANASAIFKYAGTDGGGDSESYLKDDTATKTTVALAATIQRELGHPVLPVMISYTVNLSLANYEERLHNKEWLAHSFGNFIVSLRDARDTSEETIPAGYIVNPDFLGECQRQFSPTYEMPVREPLVEALAHHGVDLKVPDDVEENLKGYVLAVNWLARSYVENVTFGWQVNLWGVGTSEWVYSKDETAESPATAAKKTADYIKSLDVYSGDYKPDFLAIDRYEADDFTKRGYINSYCYGPYEWGRYYDFCKYLSLEMQVPVVPWQIPASRIPNRNEDAGDLEKNQWGTGGTYIFGDDQINSDYHNIHPDILSIKPHYLDPTPYQTVTELFIAAGLFDLSYPTYWDFPLRGIIAVWLGGGSTTGIVSDIGTTGPWTQQQISAYMENPVPLGTTSKSRN
ncbi:putative hydroxymethyltransferase [Hypomontagnella monticulosa]|nr:putative hydroxymethyltransferase [Hypomontagnella monticulosa]